MLELRTGEPPWYIYAVGATVLLLVISLIFNRIQPGFSLLLMLTACLIVAGDRWIRKKRGKYVSLRVSPDFSLTLCDSEAQEYPADTAGVCWVTSQMAIVPVRVGMERRMQIVVSASGNDPDAFRRFSIICRFGFAVKDS